MKKQELIIISELFENCRSSNREISKMAKLAKETVAAKISEFEKNGVIKGYQLRINYDRLGYHEYNIFLRLKRVKKNDLEKMISFLVTDDNTTWIGKAFGKFDIKVALIVKDHNRIRDFQSKIYSKFSESIENMETLLLIDKYKTSNSKFFENIVGESKSLKKTRKTSIGYEKSAIVLSKIDKEIIYNLGQNARERLTKIAPLIGVSPEAAKYRIEKLKKENIIKGFSIVLDGHKFGKVWCNILLNINEEKIEEFKTYLIKNRSLSSYAQTIGPYNFNFTLSADSLLGLYENLNEIRTAYSECIKDFEFQIFFDFFKYPKIPKCILE